MIGGGIIGDAFVGGFYAADEEAYQLWLRDPSARVGHVVHIGYHGDSATYPSYVKRLWKLRDFADGTDATHNVMRDRVKSIPTFSRSISDDLTGPVADSFGELALDNTDGALDGYLGLSVSGQPVRVKHGDPLWTNASERFRLRYECLAEAIASATQDEIKVRVRGVEHGANLPIQTAMLPNNTTAGAESNRPVPKAYGNVFNVAPPCIDEPNQIYQWNDGAVTSVSQVRVGGYPHQTDPIAISVVDTGTEVITTAAANGFYQNSRVRCPVGSMPAPGSGIWYALAWNGTVFVGITFDPGGAAKFATSPDGIAWTERTAPASNNSRWISVAWNGLVFVAIESAATYTATSPDGITWTSAAGRLPSSATWTKVAWNGTVFVAVSTSTAGATSTDGVTWTARTLPAPGGSGWIDVVWNGSVFCAISGNGSASTVAATSPDGITWTARTLATSLAWQALAWNGVVFCAVAQPGAGTSTCNTSPDGITWTARTMATSASWSAIAWDGEVLCAIATGGAGSNVANTSPDGTTWTAHTLPATDLWSAICSNGYVFCALGSTSTRVTISADGATWSGVSNSLPAPLVANTDYYWTYLTPTTGKLSATRGGAAINLTTATTGAVLVGYHWLADLTNGRIYLDSRPLAEVTLDGVAGSTSAATILPTVLASVNVDSASQTRFATTCPQPVGIYIGERRNRLEVANDLMSGLGAWYGYSRDNRLRMGRIEASYTSHDWELTEQDDVDEKGSLVIEKIILPRKQHRMGYRRNWTNQQGKLVAGVSTGDASLFSNDYLITAPQLGADEGSDGSEFHLLAVKPDFIPSLMTFGSDALTEALRRDAMFYGWTAIMSYAIGRQGSEMEPGHVVKLTHSRYWFAAGVRVPIVSVDDKPDEGKTVLKLRAPIPAYAPGEL